MEKIDIKSLTLCELEKELQNIGLPRYRAGQVYRWLHRGVTDFSQMSDLSKELREKLAESYEIFWAKTELKRISKDGTVKYLFRLNDGEYIESVLIMDILFAFLPRLGVKWGVPSVPQVREAFAET